jgi:hypothetical protein
MTATELLREIEAAGGSLTLLPDGNLQWRLVAPEFLAQLQPLKSEIIALLKERENPRPWNRLIPRADLIAAHERYEAQQAAARAKQLADDIAFYARQKAERAATPEKKPFVYRARTGGTVGSPRQSREVEAGVRIVSPWEVKSSRSSS